MRRFAVFITVTILLETAEWLLAAQFRLRAANAAEGIVLFIAVPAALSVIAYRYLAIPAASRAWRVAHYVGIVVLAPLCACGLMVLFLYGLCNIAFFGICDFP